MALTGETLESVLREIRNYFVVGVYAGDYNIDSAGSVSLPFIKDGQYFRVAGSMLNDGVYKYPASGLKEEAFKGEIWALAVPPAVISLATEISDYVANNAATPYTSESFGGYSYTKATDANGAPISWRKAFASRLNAWRKI